MKFLNLFILLLSLISFSQKNGYVTYKSFYATTQATEELKERNRVQYQEALDEEMMAKMLRFKLEFNTDESLFYLSESLISDYESISTKNYVTGAFYGYDKFYTNRKKDSLVEQLYYSFAILLKKKKASFINWTLTSESKDINGYLCYKATYTYIQKWKGREFPWPVVAWYCPAIPIPIGPTRYSGLPGLILELHEDKRGFVVEKIEFTDIPVKIKIPVDGEEINDDEIKKRDEELKRDILNQD
ncbi:GLPGLI family protein [Flavobacterium sp.]|uniref:GLPGLI family protein n=1 Tax=Flavobacterium sp. TaxID=239 RepID=UPI004047FCC7